MSRTTLQQLDSGLTEAKKLLGQLQSRHEIRKEKVAAIAAQKTFSAGGESLELESQTQGSDLDGDQKTIGVKVGSGAVTVTGSETQVHAVDTSGNRIETPDMAGSGLMDGEESPPIAAHTRMEHSSSTSVGYDASKSRVTMGRSNSTNQVDFEGDDPNATAEENQKKRGERTRTRTHKESVDVSVGSDGASMSMKFEDSDSQTGASNTTSMGMGVDREGNVTSSASESHTVKNDMGGTDTTSTSVKANLATGELSGKRTMTSVDKDGDGGSVDVGGGVNASAGTANLSLGATGKVADKENPGKSKDAVSVKASGAVDTHLDDGRGLGVSGEYSQDVMGFTLSVGGGYDFVVYNPVVDHKTGVVTVKAAVKSSTKGGAGMMHKGTGLTGSMAQAEGRELIKKFGSLQEAQEWFALPREQIMKEMTGFAGVLSEGESRSMSESDESKVGGSAKLKAVSIGHEETSKTEFSYSEKGGKNGQITITIAVKESEGSKTTVGGSVGAVDASVGQSDSASQGRSYSFVLNQNNENYEELRKELRNAGTVKELEALRDDARFKDHVGKETISSSEGSSTGFKTGAAKGAVSVGSTQRSEKKSSVTRDDDTLTGEFSGKQGIKIDGSLGGVSAAVDQEEGVQTSLNSAGQREVDLQKQIKMEGLLSWITSYKTKLSGYKVSDKDFAKVEIRAKDKQKWGWCNCYPRVDAQEAWENLRKRILQPRTHWSWFDPEWAELDFDMLRKLLQMAEVADYMGDFASKGGHDGWVSMLRNWGQRPGLNAEHSTAEDLGSEYEWKSALKKEQALYYKIETQVEVLPKKIEKMFQEYDINGAENLCLPLLKNIETVRKGISSYDGFDSKRALIEMLKSLDEMEQTVRFQLSLVEEGGQSTEEGYEEQLRTEIQQILSRCSRAKKAETQLLTTMRNEFPDEIVPESESYLDTGIAMFKAGYAAVTPNDSWHYWDEVIELYDQWIKDIRDCRKLYAQTSLSERDWEVSTDGQANRNDALEPDAREFIRLALKGATWDKDKLKRSLSRYLKY